MSAHWERLARDSQGEITVSDLQSAAYRLVMEQVIYGTERGSRAAYEVIVKNLGTYRNALEALGMTIQHNSFHNYVVATPMQHVGEKMRLAETHLALVLRWFYDERMHRAEVVDGEATVELEDLERAYKELLGRELPERGALRELVAAMKRYGLARAVDAADDQPFQVVIRPGIVDVLGETALHQLAAHAPNEQGEADEVA
jgi:hypothetical protein